MKTEPKIGQVTVAPRVLATTARLTALAVPGVARLVSPAGIGHTLQSNGVKIEILDDKVHVKVYAVTEADANMLNVGRQIQAEVTRALQDMVGVDVQAVDVHIEDVKYPSPTKS